MISAYRLGVVLAWLVFLTAGRAETGGGRWLFVFDTSTTMKKDLPGTEAVLNRFFSSNGEGQLEAGDSVGVWTFDKQLNGQFPTFSWAPDQAAMTSSNLITFLHKQHYHTDSQLGVVFSSVNRIVAGSQRLTVVIFCDGQSEISGTPYDQGINQSFADAVAERKKSQQPFVVVLRTQFGKYIGCTLAFPPGAINLPPFPAPPPPPPVIPSSLHPVTVAPPVVVPSLVIVGKHVSTNLNEPPPVDVAVTNTSISTSAPGVVVIPPTNHVVAVIKPAIAGSNAPATNHVAVTPPAVPPPVLATPVAMAAATTNPATNPSVAVTKSTEPDRPTKILIFVGIGLLVLAVTLVVIVLVRTGRRPHASLITSSMQDDPPRK